MPPAGVTFVLCCHNSATRLPGTLAHLAAQVVRRPIPWEVVVVDNASTDETASVARDSWPHTAPTALRVVSEPQLGLSHARTCGFAQAIYEIVSFIDDDNWIYPDWCQTAWETMQVHPHAGACGGFSQAEYQEPPPWWFRKYLAKYAIGPEDRKPGDATQNPGALWGAGLTIRRSAWEGLHQLGFTPSVVDRQGAVLTSGGDLELCYALRLAGWQLWYEPRLKMRHFIPSSRLDWNYLRQSHRGWGIATVGLDPYSALLPGNPLAPRGLFKQNWQWQVAVVMRALVPHWRKLPLAWSGPRIADEEILSIEIRIGRLFELLRLRGAYNRSFANICQAPWRQSRQP